MIGMVAGLKGTLPPVYYNIKIKYTTIKFDDYVWIARLGSHLTIIVGTNCIQGSIKQFDSNIIELHLSKPACIDPADMIVLCIKDSSIEVGESFHIVAYGNLTDQDVTVEEPDLEDPFNETDDEEIDVDNI